jgi:hypothetical protein
MRSWIVIAGLALAALPAVAADRMFDVSVKLTRSDHLIVLPRIRVRALEEGSKQMQTEEGVATLVVKVTPDGDPACQMTDVQVTQTRADKEPKKRELRTTMKLCGGEPQTLTLGPPLANGDVHLTVAVKPVAESAGK